LGGLRGITWAPDVRLEPNRSQTKAIHVRHPPTLVACPCTHPCPLCAPQTAPKAARERGGLMHSKSDAHTQRSVSEACDEPERW
jgi:hypothetical protein